MSEADPLAAVWWQVWGDGLFRRETARRALLAAYERAAADAEYAARVAVLQERAGRLKARRAAGERRMAELAGEVEAAGGRDRWVYLQRLAGRKFKDIAADMGCAASRPAQIFERQAKRERLAERERQELARAENEARLAAWVRDVWLGDPVMVAVANAAHFAGRP